MILVTGASGFVGRHLIQALKARFPARSIGILTRTQPATGVFPGGVQVCCGLLEGPELSPALVRGAEIVIHLAAKVRPDSREVRQMRCVNVGGTRNLGCAAIAADCELFLHVSSAGVYGPPRGPDAFHEDDDCNPVTPYQITKWEAEEALRQIDPKRTTLNILRPAGIYGSGSSLEIPAYKRVLSRRWSLELSGDIIVHPTHVSDVVEAIIAIVEQPAPHGTVLNIGGERPIRAQDLYAMAAETLGVHRRRVVFPTPIVGPLGGLAGTLFSLMGRPKPLLGRMSRGRIFSVAVDDGRFRRRYPTVPAVKLEDGLRDHIEWAREQHLL
jgi:nucleoside-diphosphate-sugar epimerase